MEPILHFPEREGMERGESKTMWESKYPLTMKELVDEKINIKIPKLNTEKQLIT